MIKHDTPLRSRHEAYVSAEWSGRASASAAARPGAASGRMAGGAVVEYVAWGPRDEAGEALCEVPAAFGPIEIEYAAIRRGAALFDSPHRGTIRVRGADRRGFLDRMLTQALGDLAPGKARESFWLNRRGRIDADLLLAETGEEIVIDVDVHDAARTVAALAAYVFTEEVEIIDDSTATYRLAIHGASAPEVLGRAGAGPLASLAPFESARAEIAGVALAGVRRDLTGEPGFELFVPREGAEAVWDALLAAGDGEHQRTVRPAGWYAINIARIEAGTPLFNVDFGPTNLAHETSVLHERVSFRKGCYLGQEIVARIESQGRPKQMLVGLRFESELLPEAGSNVHALGEAGGMAHGEAGTLGEPVGVVTSSAPSPMLGGAAVAFAMVRSTSADAGTPLLTAAEGELVRATVTPSLRFWSR